MKKTMFRIVTTTAICACVMGISGIAAAGDHGLRDLRAQMGRLVTAQNAARTHHHPHQVHYLQGLIDKLQARIDKHR